MKTPLSKFSCTRKLISDFRCIRRIFLPNRDINIDNASEFMLYSIFIVLVETKNHINALQKF